FAQEEISRAEQAAGQIALAVAKARLIVAEREQRELAETLREVAAALNSTLDREQVLALILEQLMRVVAYDSASIMLVQREALQSVAYRSVHQHVQQAIALPVDNLRHVQTILTYQRPLIIADTAVDSRWQKAPGTELVRCWLGVPLLVQDHIIGLLNLNKTTPYYYTEEDAQVAMTFASQATTAIENARLYAQQRQYAAQLEARVAERTQELAAANEQLQELDRLKSKFVSDVTHELRTPLTNLRLYIDLLEKGNEEKRARYLEQLREHADRLAQLISDILDLSRLERQAEEASFTAVNLNELVNQVIEAHHPQAEAAQLTLAFMADDHIPPVWGQQSQLRQIITNLVANAINYTRSGSVTLFTQWDVAKQMVYLRVVDTGIGINPQELKLIFQRFYRGERTRQLSVAGTGLGLAIVQEIIASHQGQIEVESQIDKGTTFHVWLPAKIR
ncbi:MAG: GAF domain-containing protein, partial [Anaerolineales bacterium]|nr:GAF domain-containing protein [Anaerolineales bacterium]